MTGIRSHRTRRSAFTLIELLVVILIIAILVSLTAAGVFAVMGKIPEVKTRTEITELGNALQAFLSDYGQSEPPPSILVLHEHMKYGNSAVEQQSRIYLQKVFGKNLGVGQTYVDWNGDGVANGPWILSGEQVLVFFTGGIPNTAAVVGGTQAPGPQGFSTNNMNPAQAGGKRKGPYYPFESNRLVFAGTLNPSAPNFFVYLDPWKTKSGPLYATLGGSPYAFFSSAGVNNGYLGAKDSFGAMPYYTGVGQYSNSNTYQIISAGKDGNFGTSGWSPSSGATGAGADDQSNFSAGLLGAGQR